MNILFLTIAHITNTNDRGIYTDLMRQFRDKGHKVTIVSSAERRYGIPTGLSTQNGIEILKVSTLNLQKTNVIEKGIGTLLLEYQFLSAIKKYLSNVKFDLVLYSTPPITLTKVVKFVKKRDAAKTYLLLKDIFPQNAVDLNMISQGGLLHRYFRKKEKALYAVSDNIGCMSPANAAYVCANNPEIDPTKVEVCPNSIALTHEPALTATEKSTIREKYKLPSAATLFIYGGNLGKPQGIGFLLQVLRTNENLKNAFFVIVGSGTEFPLIQKWFDSNKPKNALLLKGLPKEEYDKLVKACDVGLIFLERKFTIPNYPSRLLSYLENRMPIITATDRSTDIGSIAEANGYGLSAISGDLEAINKHIHHLCENPDVIKAMGEKGYDYLKNNYTVERCYEIIMKEPR
ncbi:MAG: glycosyltransferase WbuB [Bacteroidetes bacterium HGW-Bacteroidetes-11]|jgi:glycosyltransferase involved in cell wall biosynthesis|nr:MAG: glycosyltransferase WbuB [Bacteroidetes bacterium HGW-Bacteroidetes-11]